MSRHVTYANGHRVRRRERRPRVPAKQSWDTFYADRLKDPWKYVAYLQSRYQPFFQALHAVHEDHNLISYDGDVRTCFVELGCLPGFVQVALDDMRYNEEWRGSRWGCSVAPGVTLLPESGWDAMQDLYWRTVRQLSPQFVDVVAQPDAAVDAVLRQRFDHHYPVAYSFGLLEHYELAQGRDLVETFRQQGITTVHYVPLVGHHRPSFGDERLLSAWEWVEALSPSQWFTFNRGKDLVMVMRGKDALTMSWQETRIGDGTHG